MNYKVKSYRIIDSTRNGDYRLNIIIDNRYVLRINDPVISEQRLSEISVLTDKYSKSGIKAPCLIRNKKGLFLTQYGERVCYLSEYIDYPSLSQCKNVNLENIYREVFGFIGRFAERYRDQDLMSVNSMWSLIDLAPLDSGIDEKQENLNSFAAFLHEKGYQELTERVNVFNLSRRERIRNVYKKLPRCSIQGDLNWSNILVDKGHFAGLIDFNMAGTEVNVNSFICETNPFMEETEFLDAEVSELYEKIIKTQNERLNVIFENYHMNELEKAVIEDYRSITLISRYPNVCFYKWCFEKDPEKAEQFMKIVLQRE